jgi:predicted component of type VI protein secretion system
MKKIWSRLGLLVATLAMVTAFAACPAEEKEETQEEPAKEEPAKAEIPEYKPSGDHADVKLAAAKDINADNAEATAKEVEAALDKELGGE